MLDKAEVTRIRQEVAERRFRDLVVRARRLEGAPAHETLREGLAMIASAHSLRVRA